MNKIWDTRFLSHASLVAEWSKDPSTKVGAVITDEHNRIISVGYNGFPRSIADTPERLKNRELKYKMVVHAEMNAIIFAQRDLTDCTLYTWPFPPCSACAAIVINAGIGRVVSYGVWPERWAESIKLSLDMFREAGVRFTLY